MSRVTRHRHFWPLSIAVVTIVLTIGTFPAYAAWTQQFHGGSTHVGRAQLGRRVRSRTRTPTQRPRTPSPGRPASAGHGRPDLSPPGNHRCVCRRGAAPSRPTPRSSRRRAPHRVPRCRRIATRWPAAATPSSRRATANGSPAPAPATPRSAATIAAAEPFHFQATDLGTYLLYGKPASFVSSGQQGSITAAAKPSAGRRLDR